MRFVRVIAALVLGGCSVLASAQMGSGAGAPAAGAKMAPSKAVDDMLTLYEKELTGVVEAMPAEKFGFAPSATAFASGQGAKFEGVRSFAQQVAHLAQTNYFFFSAVSGAKPDADVKAIGSMTSKDDLLAALAKSFVYAHSAVATITPQNAFDEIKGADGMKTRVTVAGFAVAHGFDHYGQMVEYLRMNGVVPPGSK
ncbi:MAG TPA: DinB family protein [Acidobacteriaceae bacterium]|jgi:uncharacterized damage-inducible protein DinB|nr:DinB family protein [Acidobacteriaceae bacterium]